jgi:hypothetical protein
MHAIARNHAPVDGNKRLAWAATRTFCLLNGRDLVFGVDDAEQLVQSVARGELEAVDIERMLEAHLGVVAGRHDAAVVWWRSLLCWRGCWRCRRGRWRVSQQITPGCGRR